MTITELANKKGNLIIISQKICFPEIEELLFAGNISQWDGNV